MYCRKNTTRICFKHIFTLGITNLADYISGNFLNIEICFDFTSPAKYYLAGGYQCFTGHLDCGIKGKKIINQGIRDLVSHFIRMAFRYTFGSK